MADTAVLLGLALLGGALATASPGPAAFAFVVTLALVRRRIGRALVVMLVIAFALGALRAGRAVARFDRARAEVRDALGGPARCVATAVVASSPVLFRSASPSLARAPVDEPPARSPPPELVPSWDANVVDIECDGRPAMRGFRARVYGGPGDLGRGDRVEVIANLAPVQIFRNEDLADPRPGAARRGVLASGGAEDVRVVERGLSLVALIDRFRARSRGRIEATFARDAAPMGRALVLGEADLDEEDAQAFRASGLAHLLAVSGTHLVLVVAGAVSVLTAILRRIEWASARWDVGRVAAALGAAFAWVYADFAGGSGSAIRAAAMLSVALLAQALGRSPHGPRALGWSLVGVAVADPLVAFDFSFLLSVAATGGLMVLQRPLASWLERPAGRASASLAARAWRPVAAALATTLSATIGCAPLIAVMAPALPIGGVLANLLAVPVGELAALPLCLGHTLLGFAPALERGTAVVASGSLLVVRSIARATQAVTWLALPVPAPTGWQFALVWSLAAWLLLRESRRRLAAAVGSSLLALAELVARHDGAPRDHLRLTMLDVGQGDASMVDLPDGRVMLFDAGGMVGSPIDTGRAVVAPVLRSRRRTAIAVVVLSHPHPDHFGGLASALDGVDVGEFWDTGQGEAEGAGPVYASLLASLRARGVPIVRPAALCDHPRSFGGATVEVLAPCPEPVPFANANDNSFVVRITFGERAVLLVGDAERAEEESLLERHREALRADFLKVGHHGSGTSSWPAFLQAVGAEECGISCGVRNRFGHPHPRTMHTLSLSGRVRRTDRDGSIRWETDGRSTAVATAARGDRASLGSLLAFPFSGVQGGGGEL